MIFFLVYIKQVLRKFEPQNGGKKKAISGAGPKVNLLVKKSVFPNDISNKINF